MRSALRGTHESAESPAPKHPSRRNGWVTVGAIVVAVLTIQGAVIVLSLLAPWLPVIGIIGPLLGAQRAGQLALLGALALVAGIGLHLLRRRALRVVVAIPAAVMLVGGLVVCGSQIGYAASVGAEITAADVLLIGKDDTPADEVVEFAKPEGTALSASIWKPQSADGASPVVLWVHGGGFDAGVRDEQAATARYLADNGYLVVSIDYRLASAEPWKDESDDVVCGLAWAEAHADSYGADPRKVAIVGGSAGGSLAMNVAYGLADGDLSSSCGDILPSVPTAVAAFYPAADLAGTYDDNGLAPVSDYAHTAIEKYLGGAPQNVPERLAYADPAGRIQPGLPPTLIVNGADDHLIRADRNAVVAERLKDAGNEAEFYEVPYSDHAYDAASPSIGNSTSRALLLRFLRDNL